MDDGAALTCDRCGSQVAASAKFCAECGAPLTSPSVVAEVRKTVTALFCDVTGSTALGSRLDPEALRHLMEAWFGRASDVIVRHGGTVEKFAGDAVMAVFGAPVAHEDDALRACRAALGVLDAARDMDAEARVEHGSGFAVRVGVETGEVLVGDPSRGSTFAAGTAINTASRLEQAAAPGECLIGPQCHQLVRDAVDASPRQALALKGIDGAVDAWLLHGVPDPADLERPLVGRLVGRSRELALLRQAFDRAVGDRTCQLATVLGVAGIGKSRLAHELLSDIGDDALVLRGRCLSYGDSFTWWPLVEIVRSAAGLSGAETEQHARDRLRALMHDSPDAGEVVERIAPAAGLGGTPGPPQDTAWAVRRLLVETARDRPVVLVLDDLHWAEAGLLTLVEDVVEWLRDAPVLVLVLARPELLDERPTWGGGRINAVTLMLEPLRPADVDALTADLVGGRLTTTSAAQVRELAGGNPLYLEHLVAMLQDGNLLHDGELGEVRMPPTIIALITARLDRLPPEERSVLATASVMGLVFHRAAVAELATGDAGPELTSLMRKGLVRPAASDIPGQDALAFTHLLVREAAYAALPKSVRADLHERFARWLDKSTEGSAYDDLVGAHLESAYLARADLGRIDDRVRDLGLQASRRLYSAAMLLEAADDVTAMALIERADRLHDDETEERWQVRSELIRQHLRYTTSTTAIEDLVQPLLAWAEARGEERWTAHARLALEAVRLQTEPEGSSARLQQTLEQVMPVFERHGDHVGLMDAEAAQALIASLQVRNADHLAHIERAAVHAARAGRHRLAASFRMSVSWNILCGDRPAGRGLEIAQQERASAFDRTARAHVALGLGFWLAMLGRTAEAATALHECAMLADDLRGEFPDHVAYGLSRIMLYLFDWDSAVPLFDDTVSRFEASGELGVLSTDLAYQALVLLHVGQVDRARTAAARALELGAHDDILTIGNAWAAQAWLAALDGDSATARDRYAAALRTFPDDLLMDRALAHLAAAEAEQLLGEPAAARRHREAALALAQLKENVVASAYVRRLLEVRD